MSSLTQLGQHGVVRRAPCIYGCSWRVSAHDDKDAISCADNKVGVRKLRDAPRALRLCASGAAALRQQRKRARAGTRTVAH